MERLKTLRKQNNITQEESAEILNIHKWTIGQYERGLRESPIIRC